MNKIASFAIVTVLGLSLVGCESSPSLNHNRLDGITAAQLPVSPQAESDEPLASGALKGLYSMGAGIPNAKQVPDLRVRQVTSNRKTRCAVEIIDKDGNILMHEVYDKQLDGQETAAEDAVNFANRYRRRKR